MATAEFFIIVPSALLAAYCALRIWSQSLEPQRKAKYLLVAWLAFGLTLGGGGLLSTLRISYSARPQIEGTISKLNVSGGKSRSSYFTVVTDDGKSVQLESLDYTPNLQNGQRVRVQYMEEYGAALDLEVLSGANAGWKFHESDSLALAQLSAFAGACFATFGLVQWTLRKNLQEDDGPDSQEG
ncbi:MAG TPA: hypothetical protein VIJ79_14075 [Acidobacteriaceae bacterium]